MFHSKGSRLAVAVLAWFACPAFAEKIVPSPLLAIDQNRSTVVERIIGQWGDALYASNAGIGAAELRQMLTGMRSDHLLAASLAGTLDGLRDVMAKALIATGESKASLPRQKSLGDKSDDLVYTPVVPCRILDTRNTSGPLLAGVTRTFIGYNATSFVVQGGVASNCGVPDGVAALSLNIAAVQPVAAGFIRLWPDNAPMPFASVLNYAAGAFATATGTIVPVDSGLNNQFDAWSPAQADFVADVVGYFERPNNYGGTQVITGTFAVDSGGITNTSTGYASTVAGGEANVASGSHSSVGGGLSDQATGAYSVVAGGDTNVASGDYGTVAGGEYNQAIATYSTVSGGYKNIASGDHSTVAGGAYNIAGGQTSFAVGWLGHADKAQCFVFANWSGIPGSPPSCLGSTNVARFLLDHGLSVDYFSARSDGGGNRWAYIGDIFAGQTISTWTGAFLSDAGVWVNASSSKMRKADFRPVDVQAVLREVARLPITTWRYKQGEGDVRHMGPMAEDFWEAFHIGYGDKTIADLDARGVALAAIQGLYQLLQDKNARIAALERRLSDLEASRSDGR
jgi:hypothetical protein